MNKITETMKEVVKNVLDRIAKDNEKMEKNIEVMIDGMEKVPRTIHEYVEL